MNSVALDAITGASLSDCFPAEAVNFAKQRMALLQGSNVEPMRILLPDGRRTATVSAISVFDEMGDVLGFLLILIDVRDYDGEEAPLGRGMLLGARPLSMTHS